MLQIDLLDPGSRFIYFLAIITGLIFMIVPYKRFLKSTFFLQFLLRHPCMNLIIIVELSLLLLKVIIVHGLYLALLK